MNNKFSTKLKTTATIILILMMMASVTLMAMPAQAQTVYTNQQEGGSTPGPLASGVTADVTLDTFASLSFTPNPIGVGQTLLVNVWLNPPLHVSRYFKDYAVTITDPNGTAKVIKIDSYRADTTAWFPYVVDQIGTWTLKFDFPGGYFPPGNYTTYPGAWVGAGVTSFNRSVYYQPSFTPVQNLTVVAQMLYSWPELPLPTDYWTRPLTALLNREWWPMAGNYPSTYFNSHLPIWNELYPGTNPYWNSLYGFTPWAQGPNSAHIVWKRQDNIAGFTGPDPTLRTTGSATNPTLVYAGRAYATQTVRWYNGSLLSCAISYDIRTGEMYYMNPTASPFNGITPNLIAYTIPTTRTGEVPGSETIGTGNAQLMSISGSYLRKINPLTGALTTNVSISPLSAGTYYMNEYCWYIQDLGSAVGAERYRLINWTTAGTSSNVTSRIVSNTTYARSSFPALYDYNVGLGAAVSTLTPSSSTGVANQIRIIGYNLFTGAQTWNITLDEIGSTYSGSCSIADHGKVAVLTQRGYWLAYDLYSGKLAWQSERMDYPWGSTSFGAYAVQSAYGMLFRESYDGVYAFNWTDGKIVWKYSAPAFAPFESPYIESDGGISVYPFNTGAKIVDGKMYVVNTEHTPTTPNMRGWGLHVINITTGELVWKITPPLSHGVIADGYLTATNSYDGYMYVFGKGKSATTVTAPDVVMPKGNGVVIKGTVLDMSIAQPGTPCVSKESMTQQMEYLHMQRPIGGLWGNETITGVPVMLTAIGSDGTVIDLGTATTNGYSGVFSLAWTPPDEGTYQIIASFAGDESYGSSLSTTAVSVGPAPAASPTATASPTVANPPYEMYTLGTGIAIIITVIVVSLLILRKRPYYPPKI